MWTDTNAVGILTSAILKHENLISKNLQEMQCTLYRLTLYENGFTTVLLYTMYGLGSFSATFLLHTDLRGCGPGAAARGPPTFV